MSFGGHATGCHYISMNTSSLTKTSNSEAKQECSSNKATANQIPSAVVLLVDVETEVGRSKFHSRAQSVSEQEVGRRGLPSGTEVRSDITGR